MTKIPVLLLLLLCFTFSPSSAVQRHLLHQPFFPVPVTSTAPAPSPHSHHHHYHYHKNHPPPPPEKHTFSSVSTPPPSPPHRNPFFPSSDPSSPTSSHSPPSPPPPASLPTFPANISSLLFPTHTTTPTKPHHTRLITITASVISAASLLSLLAVFLIFLRRSLHNHHPLDDTKSIRSDSLQLFNGAPSDGSLKHKQPPQYTSSNTSSEFLYLGTLVNSTSTGLDQTQKSPISNHNTTGVLELPAPASSSSSSSYSHHHNKIGSPELCPLPPLPKLPSFSPIFLSSEQLKPKRDHHFDGDDDEFFSPRGSSGRKPSFSDVVKDSGSNSSSPSNFVSSLNDSPVVKKLSTPPPLKRACPARPPPPPPLPPHPLQFSEALAATSLSLPPGDVVEKKQESLKPKLKALHWDKVRASSSRVTVWDQIKSNSFQVNEEMIETLFRANDPSSRGREAGNAGFVQSMNQENQFLDPRKSQNIAILLRALNVTAEEVCEALVEGELLIH